MLDALNELEHLSLSYKTENLHCHRLIVLISQKYHVFQSITQNPGEFYEEAKNAENKLEFKRIKLEFGKVAKIRQQDFFRN
jgi:ribosomal protein L18